MTAAPGLLVGLDASAPGQAALRGAARYEPERGWTLERSAERSPAPRATAPRRPSCSCWAHASTPGSTAWCSARDRAATPAPDPCGGPGPVHDLGRARSGA